MIEVRSTYRTHAKERVADRLQGYCPSTTLRCICGAFHNGALKKVSEALSLGRAFYRYTLPRGEVIYPLIAADGYIITLISPGMYVHTPTGRHLIDDLDDEAVPQSTICDTLLEFSPEAMNLVIEGEDEGVYALRAVYHRRLVPGVILCRIGQEKSAQTREKGKRLVQDWIKTRSI